MGPLVVIFIVFVLGISPFVLGRYVKVAWRGLATLGILPLLILAAGTMVWLRDRSSPDFEIQGMARVTIYFGILITGGMIAIGLIGFVIGRAMRHSDRHNAVSRNNRLHTFPPSTRTATTSPATARPSAVTRDKRARNRRSVVEEPG